MPESVSTVDAILDGLRDRSHLEDIRGHGHERVVYIDQAVAAVHAAAGLGSPDERLREALALVYVMLTGAEPMWAEMPLDERCARAANEAQQAVLAADREAPDERGVCDIHGPGIEPCECEDNILPQAAPEYRPEDFA